MQKHKYLLPIFAHQKKAILMEYTMFDTLLLLPLFQGMSKIDLTRIVEKVQLHFMKFEDKEVIFRQGERCNKLVFLLKGDLLCETVAPCGLFSMEETFDHPMVVELHSLFGSDLTFKSTYSARGEVSLLTIDKSYLFKMLDASMVFRINFYNLICNRVQKQHELTWNLKPAGLEGRIIHFIRSLCTMHKGSKLLRIRMEDLASLLDDTRLNVSSVLNTWQDRGLIEMRRKAFVVHDLAELNS